MADTYACASVSSIFSLFLVAVVVIGPPFIEPCSSAVAELPLPPFSGSIHLFTAAKISALLLLLWQMSFYRSFSLSRAQRSAHCVPHYHHAHSRAPHQATSMRARPRHSLTQPQRRACSARYRRAELERTRKRCPSLAKNRQARERSMNGRRADSRAERVFVPNRKRVCVRL